MCVHDISLCSVAIFDRSGRYVITGSDNRLVKIWSMETAFCLASCRGQVKNVYIVCHTQFFLLLLNVQTPFIPFFAHLLFSILLKDDITDLAVSSNNALVASASNDYSIQVVRTPFSLHLTKKSLISIP